MKKGQVGLLILSLIVIIALPATATWWDGGKERSGAETKKINPENMIAAKLKLTPDQLAKFKAQREEISKEVIIERLKIKELTEKLKTEMLQGQPDHSKVNNYIKAIGERRTALWLKRMGAMLEMQRSLTAEQKQEFKKLFNHHNRPTKRKHQPKQGHKW